MTDEFFTISEFTAIAGFSRQWLARLWDRGDGPPRRKLKIGKQRRIRIPRKPGLDWLQARYPEAYSRYRWSHELSPEEAWPFVTIRGAYSR